MALLALRQVSNRAAVFGNAARVASLHSSAALGQEKSTKLWGGRFARDTDKVLAKWVESVTVDSHLVQEDIWGSLAHVTMLGRQGIIPADKAAKIIGALDTLMQEFLDGKWKLGYQQEDVHMNVEATMIARLGMDVGGRMHTCRSRNDQVVLDSKLYARKRLLELRGRVLDAVDTFVAKADTQLEDPMVGYTHFQHAQPISVAFWLSHYAAVLLRDGKRLKAAYDVTDENPLGAGAISGTSFPIDRKLTTKLLGFQKVHPHSLDATSARDFMWEAIFGAATVSGTLSRLAEELILFSSYEYSTVSLDDGFAMGSSMMPQKKNPGSVELIRGRAARMTGYLTASFTMMKGLPSGYNRDFHEDKELLVASMDMINNMVEVIPALITSTTLNKKRMHELTYGNFATATELANYLVLRHNVPFREAHHVVGSLVGSLSRAGQNFSNTEACFKHLEAANIKAPREDILKILDPKQVMLSYNSEGGTGAVATKAMLEDFKAQSAEQRAQLQADSTRVNSALATARKIAQASGNVQTAADLDKIVKQYA